MNIDIAFKVLQPVLQRVRRKNSAVKPPDGNAQWRSDEELTDWRVREHLTGKGLPRGACPMEDGSSTTRLALFDLDSHKGATSWPEMLSAASRVASAMEREGLRPTAFRSGGGNGIHLIVLWDAHQDAHSVRMLMISVLESCDFYAGSSGVAAGGIEVFPKQAKVETGKFGSQFFLPLARKSVPLDLLFGEVAALEDVTWRMSDPVPFVEAPVRPSGGVGAVSIATLRYVLSLLPNDGSEGVLSYEEWRNRLFAIHHASGGSEEGMEIAIEYSRQNKSFDSSADAQFIRTNVWPNATTAGGITFGTLTALVREKLGGAGKTWNPPAELDFADVETGESSDWSDATPALASDGGEALMLPASSFLSQEPQVAVGLIDHTAVSVQARDTWKEKISGVETELDLRKLCPLISVDGTLLTKDREALAQFLIKAFAKFGTKFLIASTRSLIHPPHKMDAQKREMTEFGNAERMIDKFGKGLMYVPDIDTWYIWTQVYWRRALGPSEIELYAKQTVSQLGLELDSHSDNPAEFYEFCRFSQRAQMVANMVKLAQSDSRVMVPAAELDKDPYLLGVRNGVVNLRDGSLVRPDPKLRITLVAGCDYVPDARAPLFEQTIRDVFFDKMEMVEYVMRTFGYALMGNPVEDMMFIAFGNGANGKSTIFNAVRQAFGAYARAADASSFVSNDSKTSNAGGAREDLVRLRGARFVYVNEPDEGGELREGTVKSMTGGDAISARANYAKNSIEIVPTWTVFMPTNHKPIIKGSDNGIWRRMGLIPFERNFSADPSIVDDKHRKNRVAEELVGILALLVKAALRYQKVGLTAPPAIKAARDQYRSDMDMLSEWLDECCEIDSTASVAVAELWKSWRLHAGDRGLLNYIRSSNALSRRLDNRFHTVKGTGGVKLKAGLRLRVVSFGDVDPFS